MSLGWIGTGTVGVAAAGQPWFGADGGSSP